MRHRPDSTALATKRAALAQLPEAVQAMPTKMQRAWRALANGERIRDAAAAAGVPISTVWSWRRTHKPFRSAVEARYAAMHDDAQDVMTAAMQRATPEADARDIGNALKAAGMVQRGLGIGVPLGGANAGAPANVTVHVAVGLLGGVVGSPSISQPTWDVEVVPTVAETQPSRSASSSRRPARSGSARGE